MKTLHAFGIFLLIRIASVYLVQTWSVPDEYWQSLEVAHKFTYGYGHLTWEWMRGIRSYIHPILITILYKVLQFIGLDSAQLLILVPRLFQSILSAYSDLCFWRWCGKSKWSIFCIGSAWFWFYNGSRTVTNTLEMSITTIALSHFPFKSMQGKNDNNKFIWLIGLICAIRPTAAIVWCPLVIYHLMTSHETALRNFITRYLPITLVVITMSGLLDSWAHGSMVMTWYEFLKLNVFEGVGSWYGTLPWHWYLSQGLPAVMGVWLVPFLIASLRVLKYRDVYVDELALLASITFTVSVYSCLGHKEFRFILPLLPLALYVTANYLSNWSRKASDMLLWMVAGVLLMGNLVPAVYFSQIHQRGTLDVMSPLREISVKDPATTSLLFLMPCHSTPLYSHLHVNVTTRFLTCNPNLSNVKDYVDEADQFYNSPGAWLRNNYPPTKPLPSHIIAFDCLVPHLQDILSRYKPTHRIFHTNYPLETRIGRYVIIHERIDFNN